MSVAGTDSHVSAKHAQWRQVARVGSVPYSATGQSSPRSRGYAHRQHQEMAGDFAVSPTTANLERESISWAASTPTKSAQVLNLSDIEIQNTSWVNLRTRCVCMYVFVYCVCVCVCVCVYVCTEYFLGESTY